MILSVKTAETRIMGIRITEYSILFYYFKVNEKAHQRRQELFPIGHDASSPSSEAPG